MQILYFSKKQSRRQQHQTYRQIVQALGIGQSTVARILKRKGLNRLAVLSPARPDNRYEHDAPGHRVTGDRQQNTAGAGWEYTHVAIDDHSRLAYNSFTWTRRVGALAWPCSEPCATTPAWASALVGYSPITAPATGAGG